MKRLSVLLFFLVRIAVAAASSSTFHSSTTAFHRKSGSARMPLTSFSRPQRPPAFLSRADLELRVTSISGNNIFALRGGEMAEADDDDENVSSFLISSLRSLIRDFLDFGDNTAPIISSVTRPFVRIVEKLTGLSLLPDVKVKVKKSKKKKSSKKKVVKDEKGSDESDAAQSKKEKKSKLASKALKKPSATTKKHISGSLKSTNPNYRIQKELKEFIQAPPPNLSVQVGSNIRAWVVTMVGANNTIYEGEVFKLRINFPKDYPTVPPSVYFLKGHIPTHEHVYTNGDICLSLLGKDWRPTMTAQSIANSILSILSSAQHKALPMDNANHANAKPGEYQKDWVYHDDNC